MALAIHGAPLPSQSCNDGSACQLAAEIVAAAITVAPLNGRNVFVDLRSFGHLADVHQGEVLEEHLRAALEEPFRVDVDSVVPFRPGPGYTSRLRHDPFLIRVDSVRGAEVRAAVFLTTQVNVRAANPDATAVFVDHPKLLEIIVERREGRWTVVSRCVVGTVYFRSACA